MLDRIVIEKIAALRPDVKLFPHQQEAIDSTGNRTIYAHATGAGKTLTGIAKFEKLKAEGGAKKALVVVPAGLRHNFANDGIRKFTDSTVNIVGTQDEKRKGLGFDPNPDADYNVVSYEVFRKDPMKFLDATGADTIITDESHRGRNEGTATLESLKDEVVQSRINNYIGLTGSVTNNTAADILPLVDVASGGRTMLGRNKKEFMRMFAIRDNAKAFRHVAEERRPVVGLRNRGYLKKELGPYVHYLDHGDVKTVADFPDKDLEVIKVPISHEQAKLYKRMLREDPKLYKMIKQHRYDTLKDDELASAFNAMNEMRKLMNDPKAVVGPKGGDSPKLERLVDDMAKHLQENEDGQAIILSHLVNGGIGSLEKELQERGIGYGKFIGKGNEGVTEETRQQAVKDFRERLNRVMLISSAGGEGISLPDTTWEGVLDPHYNPEKMQQMEARGVRAGGLQHRKGTGNRVVDVNRYIATMPKTLGFIPSSFKTPDEVILEIAAKKERENAHMHRLLKEIREEKRGTKKVAMDVDAYLEKLAESTALQDFVSGFDPTGVATFRNAMGNEKNHTQHKIIGNAGGFIGGATVGAALPAGALSLAAMAFKKKNPALAREFDVMAKGSWDVFNPRAVKRYAASFKDIPKLRAAGKELGLASKEMLGKAEDVIGKTKGFSDPGSVFKGLGLDKSDDIFGTVRSQVDGPRSAYERLKKAETDFEDIASSMRSKYFKGKSVDEGLSRAMTAVTGVGMAGVTGAINAGSAHLQYNTALNEKAKNGLGKQASYSISNPDHADKPCADGKHSFNYAGGTAKCSKCGWYVQPGGEITKEASLQKLNKKRYWQMLKRLHGGPRNAMAAAAIDPGIYHGSPAENIPKILAEGLKRRPKDIKALDSLGNAVYLGKKEIASKYGDMVRLKLPSELSGLDVYPNAAKFSHTEKLKVDPRAISDEMRAFKTFGVGDKFWDVALKNPAIRDIHPNLMSPDRIALGTKNPADLAATMNVEKYDFLGKKKVLLVPKSIMNYYKGAMVFGGDKIPANLLKQASVTIPRTEMEKYAEDQMRKVITSDDLALIARMVHEINRHYNRLLMDRLDPSWDQLDDKDKANRIQLLAETVPDVKAISAKKMHDMWVTQQEKEGWVFGEAYDKKKKTHPCIVSWKALPDLEKAKDAMYLAVIKALVEEHFGIDTLMKRKGTVKETEIAGEPALVKSAATKVQKLYDLGRLSFDDALRATFPQPNTASQIQNRISSKAKRLEDIAKQNLRRRNVDKNYKGMTAAQVEARASYKAGRRGDTPADKIAPSNVEKTWHPMTKERYESLSRTNNIRNAAAIDSRRMRRNAGKMVQGAADRATANGFEVARKEVDDNFKIDFALSSQPGKFTVNGPRAGLLSPYAKEVVDIDEVKGILGIPNEVSGEMLLKHPDYKVFNKNLNAKSWAHEGAFELGELSSVADYASRTERSLNHILKTIGFSTHASPRVNFKEMNLLKGSDVLSRRVGDIMRNRNPSGFNGPNGALGETGFFRQAFNRPQKQYSEFSPSKMGERDFIKMIARANGLGEKGQEYISRMARYSQKVNARAPSLGQPSAILLPGKVEKLKK